MTDPGGRSLMRQGFIVLLLAFWGIAAGIFATLFHVPGPASGGGAQPAGWPAAVFFSIFIPILTVFLFIFTGLVIYGLRGDD